jgi:ABC-type multidrug transport system ATPase subunit
MNSLELDTVSLEFNNRRILQDVYLKVNTGEVVAILGRNGAGKSSLYNILFGAQRTTHHTLRINGKTILKQKKILHHIKMLPQHHFIPKQLRIGKILNQFQIPFKELLHYFPHFKQAEHAKFKNLSGGNQRIIEVFSILKSKSDFCILDEPFTHLMPLHIEIIEAIIQEEKGKKGIIISDHLTEHITRSSDRQYLLEEGILRLLK